MALDAQGGKAWRQALWVWCAFFVLFVLINGTVPFLFGADLHAWTASKAKSLLIDVVIYAGMFMFVPLVIVKGWSKVRQPLLILPILLATAGIAMWTFVPPAAALAVIAIIFLHQRYNLADLGIRSRGWRGDAVAILLMGVLQLAPVPFQPGPHAFSVLNGAVAGLDRWLANPASTVENLFYFGFVTERLSPKLGRWLTPPVIGAMYTAHEMSNPEYWYGGLPFGFVFVGVTVAAALYLWRRNSVAIYLGDGLGRFFSQLF